MSGRAQVIPLMELDGKRAVSLYIQQSDSIPASEVVPQLLKAAKNDEQFKPLLHSYLHALFEKDPNAGKNFHYLQVCPVCGWTVCFLSWFLTCVISLETDSTFLAVVYWC